MTPSTARGTAEPTNTHPRAVPAFAAALALALVGACSSGSTKPPTTGDPAASASAPIASSTPSSSSSSAPSATAAPAAYGQLDTPFSSFDFGAQPELVQRITESPHAYYRFTASASRRLICEAFAPHLGGAPRVRLQGDAHIEQYAVTDLGRWIIDYDDAAVGPAVIDLAHMAGSLVLGVRQLGGSADDQARSLAELVRGYRDGLAGKRPPKDPPPFAKPLAAKVTNDKRAFLESSDKAMALPLDAASDAFARAELADYAAIVAKSGVKRPPGFFDVKRVGGQKLGIGSARVKGWLFRVEGPTKSDDDDVVIEVKEISDVSGAACVTGIRDGAVVERAASQKRAGLDKKLLPPAVLTDANFWASEWLANYYEVKLKKLTPADLPAVAYETGLMLAVEHLKPLPNASKGPDAKALALSPETVSAIGAVGVELADGTEAGWRRFKTEVAERGGSQ